MIKRAFILAGGFGTRLGDITKKKPKPLIEFHKKPFIDYIISQLVRKKIPKIYILTHYKHKMFKDKYHLKKIDKTKIICKKERVPMGTAGTIYNARKLILNNTIILNGDTYINIPFNKIEKFSFKKSILLIFLTKNFNYKSNKKLSALSIKKKKIVYSNNSKNNLMNLGLYFINKNINKYLNKNHKSLEEDILPKLIKRNLVSGIKYKGKFVDIGTKKNLKIFNKISKEL